MSKETGPKPMTPEQKGARIAQTFLVRDYRDAKRAQIKEADIDYQGCGCNQHLQRRNHLAEDFIVFQKEQEYLSCGVVLNDTRKERIENGARKKNNRSGC